MTDTTQADEDAFFECEEDDFFEEECMHTLQVSISETECQCTGCLRIWKKPEGFVSDIPWQDRG